MNHHHTVRLATLIGALGLLLPAAASADVLTSPYPEATVTIAEINNGQWVCFENDLNDNFQWFQVGDSNGLRTNFVLNMRGSDDLVQFSTPHLANICGGQWSVGYLDYNGFFFDVDGKGGSDGLHGGEGDTWLIGGDQGDWLSSACDNCTLGGGNHRDHLEAWGWYADHEILLGEGGDDCFEDRTGDWGTINGGSGNDAWESSGTSVPGGMTSVETTSWLKWGSNTCLNFAY